MNIPQNSGTVIPTCVCLGLCMFFFRTHGPALRDPGVAQPCFSFLPPHLLTTTGTHVHRSFCSYFLFRTFPNIFSVFFLVCRARHSRWNLNIRPFSPPTEQVIGACTNVRCHSGWPVRRRRMWRLVRTLNFYEGTIPVPEFQSSSWTVQSSSWTVQIQFVKVVHEQFKFNLFNVQVLWRGK